MSRGCPPIGPDPSSLSSFQLETVGRRDPVKLTAWARVLADVGPDCQENPQPRGCPMAMSVLPRAVHRVIWLVRQFACLVAHGTANFAGPPSRGLPGRHE